MEQGSSDQSIGRLLKHSEGGARFIGYARADMRISKTIHGDSTELQLHERGLRIRKYQKAVIIQYQVDASKLKVLDLTGRIEDVPGSNNEIGRLILGLLMILTLGVLLLFFSNPMRNSEEYGKKYVHYLRIHFHDANDNEDVEILISGGKRKICRFIKKYNALFP